jgi:glycosyltransferase involved in cell wall biosynthesis
MSRKRILFVEQNRDGTIGGSHHSLLLLVKHLDRARFEPVVGFYQNHPLIDEFKKHASLIDLQARQPHGPGHSLHAAAPARLVAVAVRKARNLLQARTDELSRIALTVAHVRPDVIHLNNSVGYAGLEWLLAARLSGAKWITHQRGYSGPTYAARRLDHIVCISRSVEADLVARAPYLASRIVQIYNGIDIDTFARTARATDPAQVRSELGLAPDELLIGLVGNFQSWKGQDVLLRALPELDGGLRWRVLLVGATPTDASGQQYYSQVLETIAALGLKDRVILTGYRSDVPAILNTVDVVVHTSVLPEPMGRVLLEGMALGKTVIATDHGGPREVLESERSGLLLPPGDHKALAACLNRVLTLPLMRQTVGACARQRVATTFSAAECARRVQELYG